MSSRRVNWPKRMFLIVWFGSGVTVMTDGLAGDGGGAAGTISVCAQTGAAKVRRKATGNEGAARMTGILGS